ncbi:efflux RND transporter periplasmic adaptor subunit [uncultured Cedecea sp.]|uniref:efflux RND transporter periplasmic adaptor subunit n=1 Tax=uncultured Cedecea sp. TaxID=988762 RepID=UPI002616AC28|nr:efflux RND transporter periplasmic adaptor subunit [uncultured Cedecea sp.]
MVSSKLKLAIAVAGGLILGSIIMAMAYPYLYPDSQVSRSPAEREVLFWYDPMKPDTKFDKPGKSPFMDMDLVPKYRDEADASEDAEGVRINPVLLQNLGLKTEKSHKGHLQYRQRLPANIGFNDHQFAIVQARSDGFVERVYPLTLGDKVQAGTPLIDITIPEWVEAQSEYLLLSATGGTAGELKGILERLRLAGMPQEDIQRLRKERVIQTHFTLKAPITGVITAFDLRNGMNIAKDNVVAQIQGIDPVWVTAAVPESLAALLNDAAQLSLSIPAYPDEDFVIQQWSLLPGADPATRTLQIRIPINNRQQRLKPGMNAYLNLHLQGPEQVLIPAPAIIDTGQQQRVITVNSQGRFVPKTIKLVRESESQAAVEGLAEGESVVVNGLFLIDSEANINGALERLQTPENLTDDSLRTEHSGH